MTSYLRLFLVQVNDPKTLNKILSLKTLLYKVLKKSNLNLLFLYNLPSSLNSLIISIKNSNKIKLKLMFLKIITKIISNKNRIKIKNMF